MIQVDAPNLESLYTLHGVGFRTESGIIGSCIIRNLAVSKSLKSIRILCNARITDEWLNRISIGNGNLSKLKQLSLDGCHNVKRVRISSTSLDAIELSINGLEEIRIVDAPRLQYLKFWYAYQSPPNPSFVLNDASASSTMANIWLQGYNHTHNALEYEKLVKFLGIFTVLRKLKVTFYGSVVVPSDIRKLLNPPLAVKDQKLNYVVQFCKKHTNINQVIDGLLWLSVCGPETITINFGHYVSKKFQFEYKKDDNTPKMCGYCESLPVKCWRHCLDKVTIINSRLEKRPINVKKDAEVEEFFKTATDPRIIL